MRPKNQRILQSSCRGGKGGIDGEKVAGGSVAKLSQGQKRAINKIDRIINNSKNSDIEGALKDTGTPVPKPGGGYWDHLKEVSDVLRGLRNHAETLKSVKDPAAQAVRQRAIELIDRIESAVQGFGI